MTTAITTVEYVRAGEVAILAVVGACYVHALWTTVSGLLTHKARTPLVARYALGRIFRHIAILSALIGATHALVVNFDNALTLRSICWMTLAWAAFIAFLILDRNRWEAE